MLGNNGNFLGFLIRLNLLRMTSSHANLRLLHVLLPMLLPASVAMEGDDDGE